MALFLLLITQITMMAMTMTARAATTGTIRLTLVTKASSWDSRSPEPEPPGTRLSLTSLAGARVPTNRQCFDRMLKYYKRRLSNVKT